MNIREIKPTQVNLMHERDSADWWVDLESFFDFSFWMARELEELVGHRSTTTQAR